MIVQPAGHGGGPGCTTPRLAWLSHTSRELIWSAARTCSTADSPAPDDVRLLARLRAWPNAAVAASGAAGPGRRRAPTCRPPARRRQGRKQRKNPCR